MSFLGVGILRNSQSLFVRKNKQDYRGQNRIFKSVGYLRLRPIDKTETRLSNNLRVRWLKQIYMQ